MGFFLCPVNYFLCTLVGMLDSNPLGKTACNYVLVTFLPSFWIPRVPPWTHWATSLLSYVIWKILLYISQLFSNSTLFFFIHPCEGAINKQLDSVMSLSWYEQVVVGLMTKVQHSWFPTQLKTTLPQEKR